jgi:hypothetical protein
MNELEQKKLIINRIISHLPQAPANAVNEMMREPLASLEETLAKLATKREHERIQRDAQAQIDEMRRESAFEGAWAHCLVNVSLNGKKLADTEANKSMLESMLQPHETPSAAIYETIVKQYPHKFSFETPRKIKSAAECEAEFVKICRENLLSECDANRELHRKGVSLDAWAGASALERAKYQEEATRERQRFLIHDASPDQLRQEARYEFQTGREAAIQADAKRREELVAEAQRGLYAPLPAVNANGEVMDAKYFRRISTVNYELFRALVKRHGSSQITARLRGE